MLMGLVLLGIKNNCSDEGQQQFRKFNFRILEEKICCSVYNFGFPFRTSTYVPQFFLKKNLIRRENVLGKDGMSAKFITTYWDARMIKRLAGLRRL
jgi:hypothetical protein